jgi:hypothetical protein
LLRLTLRTRLAATTAAASPASPAGTLPTGLLLLLLLLGLWLRRTGLRGVSLAPLRSSRAIPFPARLAALRPLVGFSTPLALAAAGRALFLPSARTGPSGALLPFPKLLGHVAARLRFRLLLERIVATVGTALPSLRVGLLARVAENAFGQRHVRKVPEGLSRRSPAEAAHCTLPAMDGAEERRRTLLALIGLAEGHSPSDCWDDQRAMALLRSQSSPGELRQLGVEEAMIEHIFAEEPER